MQKHCESARRHRVYLEKNYLPFIGFPQQYIVLSLVPQSEIIISLPQMSQQRLLPFPLGAALWCALFLWFFFLDIGILITPEFIIQSVHCRRNGVLSGNNGEAGI